MGNALNALVTPDTNDATMFFHFCSGKRRAVLALLSLFWATPAFADDVIRVAVDAAAASDAVHRQWGLVGLQRKIVLRLTQEGFAVVPAEAEPDLVLSITGTPRVLRLTVSGRGSAGPHRIASEPKRRTGLHLEIAQQAVGMLRAAANDLPAREEATPVSRTPPPAKEPMTLEIGLGGGAALRGDAIDATGQLSGRLGDAWGLALDVGLSPSRQNQMSVVESHLALGIDRQHATADGHWLLGAGIVAGLGWHHFQSSAGAGEEGSRFNPVLYLLARVAWRITGNWSLQLWAAPGWTFRARTIERGSREVWSASALRLRVGLATSVSFEL
jgi:hypothetical protein